MTEAQSPYITAVQPLIVIERPPDNGTPVPPVFDERIGWIVHLVATGQLNETAATQEICRLVAEDRLADLAGFVGLGPVAETCRNV